MPRAVAPFGTGLLLTTLLVAFNSEITSPEPPRVIPNNNRVAGGHLEKGVLSLELEVREGRWYPDSDDGPSLDVLTFAEAGRQPQNPGPLIRVPAGTMIRLSIHSMIRDSVLVLYGLHPRPGSIDDTVQVPPGSTRQLSFPAGAPGTYFYWGSTTHQSVDVRNGIDSQLHGAFIIDPPGGSPAPDRVFVLGSWTGPADSSGIRADLRVINGLSWPHTERLTYGVGETIRWRWVNPTDSPHPMHLHGFYFDVVSRGTWAADTVFSPAERPHVVTEMPLSGETFVMQWIPEEPGNWLIHCHVAYHTSIYLSARPVPDPDDPIAIDPMHGMRGMVFAITVTPGRAPGPRPDKVAGARRIRLVARAAARRFRGALDEMVYVRDDEGHSWSDSVPLLSSVLVLQRNEPVRITIVNRTRAPTAVHWHGIEVPSYSDGVPGWSGIGSRIAPTITPGDSFVAAFTPPRSGTFIYHAHSNESFQVSLGLYGTLLVVDSTTYRPDQERIIVLGSDGPGTRMARINGRLRPDTLQLTAGITYRLRLIHIIPDWTIRVSLWQGDSVVRWRTLAKDGMELASSARISRPATLIAGPGETFDFEYRPSAPGLLRLEVEQRTRIWKTQLPIRVTH